MGNGKRYAVGVEAARSVVTNKHSKALACEADSSKSLQPDTDAARERAKFVFHSLVNCSNLCTAEGCNCECHMKKKPYLTVREQEFYFFVRRNRLRRQCDIADAMGISKQRVHQLMVRLKEKGYEVPASNGKRAK